VSPPSFRDAPTELGFYPSSAISLSKSATADVDAQASDVQLRIGESILPIVVMDSGLALRAPRNDGVYATSAMALGCSTGRYPADNARSVEGGVSSIVS
jgi:hypothetical protein